MKKLRLYSLLSVFLVLQGVLVAQDYPYLNDPECLKDVTATSGITKLVTVRVIYDNYVYTQGMTADWGYSILIEGLDKVVLFDTGTRPDIFDANFKRMGLDATGIDAILLSHEHTDHTGGITAFVKMKTGIPVVIMPHGFGEAFNPQTLLGGHVRAAMQTSVLILALLTALTGVLYPLAVTGISRTVAPGPSGGSLIRRNGRTIGSELLGQAFTDPRYFLGRPSATAPACNAGASGGSNLGPTSGVLADSLRGRVTRWRALDPRNTAPVPVDLVTASGSGLDPDLSPAAAYYQASRVARLRAERGRGTDAGARPDPGRQLGVLGEPRVNVLRLNLALDDLARDR